MCNFKRSINSFVTIALLLAGVGFMVVALVVFFATSWLVIHQDRGSDVFYTIIVLFVVGFILWILAAISEYVIPPDFDYAIRVVKPEDGDFIVFEFYDQDCRKLSRNFEVTSKNWKYMVLEDGYARIRIAYDRSVEEFLKGIKK